MPGETAPLPSTHPLADSLVVRADPALWQILDVGSIWMREFASALGTQAPTVAWWPEMLRFAALGRERLEHLPAPPLTVRRYPLQRGYSRPALAALFPFAPAVLRRLRRVCTEQRVAPEATALIVSTPFYAPVAERWPGPVVYYVTDMTAQYEGLSTAQVVALDRRLARVARAVCPNSRRIADYFVRETGCDPARLTVVPNATRESNVAPAPLLEPGPLPPDLAGLATNGTRTRPVAGVIGDLSGNMDWPLIEAAVAATAGWLQWVFVGPTTRTVADPAQRDARARTMALPGARFVGPKPYGELQSYARCFDVAVLPYRKREPTFSGSSTRFYEHLAACRPMVATRGFAELLEKPPLLLLADTPAEIAGALETLRRQSFRDGQEEARWAASRLGTWEERARTLRATISPRPARAEP